MKRVLFVQHTGAAVRYFASALEYLARSSLFGKPRRIDLKVIPLEQYPSFDDSVTYDVLIYHTFANARHRTKFPKELAERTDEKFLKHPGFKMLFDSHDSGSKDAYERFDEKYPRIKNTPAYELMEPLNVVLPTTFPTKKRRFLFFRKSVDISYCVGLQYDYGHGIRQKVYDLLKDYDRTDSKHMKNDKKRYHRHLRSVLISVNVPGWGEACFRHLLTLNAKAVMFAHESIKQVKLLPHCELEDGIDFVSFNLDNFLDKLDYLMSHRDEAMEIANNGYTKFIKGGYSEEETARRFLKIIREV